MNTTFLFCLVGFLVICIGLLYLVNFLLRIATQSGDDAYAQARANLSPADVERVRKTYEK